MANNHHEYEEVHLTDDDAEDIELVSGGGGGRQRRAAPPLSSSGGSNSSATKWIVILFLIVLVGVYKLGMEEGKAEVQHEGFDGGGGGINDNYSEVDVKQTQHENDDNKDVQEEQIKQPETTTTTTTVPPKPPMKFTMDHLTKMRTECNNLINTLNDYYYGEDKAIAMLMNSHIAPWDFNEVELDHVDSSDESTFVNNYPPRKLRAVKLVNTMLRALVSDSQRTFLMGGIGSSVMAGHDNW
eukprot:scaffold24319_cov139-Skeletonema_dohrnii-CCMP3373.AAC.2